MRFTRLLVLIALIASGMISLSALGQAEDFTFVVPVSVSHLPSEIDYLGVTCDVYGAPGVQIGQGGTTAGAMPVTGGAYHGDVTVAFNASPGRDAHAATTYQCHLSMSHSGPPTLTYFGEGSSWYRAAYPDERTFPLQPGAPYVEDTRLQPLPH